jgi:hypothetical protein
MVKTKKRNKIMAIDFAALLTDEQKRTILEQRISQFAVEAYQHSLNRKSAEVANSEVATQGVDKNLEILEAAITVHQEALAELAEVVVTTTE